MNILLISSHIYPSITKLFSKLADKVYYETCDTNDDITSKVLYADLIVFTGGADITPSMYNERRDINVQYTSPKRDRFELAVYNLAKVLEVPMVGICRGAQLLCIANGGKLLQHINGHGVKHNIKTIDGESFEVTSTHHQMMVPNTTGVILGWAKEANSWSGFPSNVQQNSDSITKLTQMEPEVVYWKKTKSIGFQYHPENMDAGESAVNYFIKQIKEKVLEEDE